MNRKLNKENRIRLPSFNEADEGASPGKEAVTPEETSGEETGAEASELVEPTEPPARTEKTEETKLKAKYPVLKTKGASSFLAQKRLQRGGHKFFDSGDYNLVKGKKPGLSGATSGVSKTKPETAKKEVKEEVPVSKEELGHDIPTADAIISRRMALFRTKSESYAEEMEGLRKGRSMRSGSMFVTGSGTGLDRISNGPGAGISGFRRGSMFPAMMSPPGGSDEEAPPQEMLQRRRQSMIPAIPSKLAL